MSLYSYTNKQLLTEVFIPSEKIQLSGHKIKLFALDMQTIGLSNNPPLEWTESYLWMQEVDAFKEEDNIRVVLPPKVVKFYKPTHIELIEKIEHNNVLLSIH